MKYRVIFLSILVISSYCIASQDTHLKRTHSHDESALSMAADAKSNPAKKNLDKHICKTCNKFFSHITNLKKHLLVHTGEKPYSCKQCNKAFSQAGNLERHILTHTGEKPYKCEQCDKEFAQLSDRKKHIRICHTGEKPFACLKCTQHFATSSHLAIHMRRNNHTNKKSDKTIEYTQKDAPSVDEDLVRFLENTVSTYPEVDFGFFERNF